MSTNSLASLAWRNLWRNRRRTLITLASIIFGFFLAILGTALQDRNWDDMINIAARLGGGHLSIQSPEYQDSPTLKHSLNSVTEALETARSQPGVTNAVPRVLGQAMINTAHESYGAAVIAFDPGLEDETTLGILEGLTLPEEFLRGEHAILLGQRLAENLRAELGDKIVYTLTDKNGDITSGMARLRGMVKTGAPSLDAGLALLPLNSMRETLGLSEDQASQVAVFLNDQRKSEHTAESLQEELTGHAVLPWNKARPELATFIALKVGGALFMQVLIAILVAAGIFNTLFVSVMERVREFGIMRAIGWPSGRLFRLVMLESLFLALVGLVAGVLVTAGPYYFLSRRGIDISAMLGEEVMEVAGVGQASVLQIGIFPENAVRIALFALVAVLLAGIYPAWKAGRIEPVEAIKLV